MVVPLIAALSSCDDGREKSLLSKLRAAIGSETEPNPSAATATPIGNQARLRANIVPATEVDFYSFTASAGDRVYAATMTAASPLFSSTDSLLDVFGPDGTTLLETDDDDGALGGLASTVAGTPIPADGTYYARVSNFSTTAPITPYDFYFRRQNVPAIPEVEPNNTSATAQPFPATGFVDGSLSATTDIDVYSINLNAGDTIYVSVDGQPTRAGPFTQIRTGLGIFSNLFLVVNDTSGTSPPPSEAFFMTVQTTGQYFIFMDIGGGTAFGAYRLAATVFPRDQVGATCTTYTSADVPKVIPTGPGQVTSTINVPGAPVVADLTVSLGFTHTAPGDLDVQLTAPGGNTVDLFTDPPNPAAPIPPYDFTLDEAAGIPIGTFGPANNMVLQPESLYRLHWFNGQPAGGNWTLTMNDDLTANGGTLTAWSMRICEPAPAPTCASGLPQSPLVTFDFESGAAGFTHSGTLDSWALGTPTVAPITTCNGGTQCWKTNLTGTYSTSSTQDLVSPNIDLTTAIAPARLSWAMKYQMDSAAFDHAWVEIQNSDGTNPTRLWEYRDGDMIDTVGNPVVTVQMSAGWGTTTADVSAYVGRTVRLVFHLDSNTSVNRAGLAIDDVSVRHCPAVCGNSVIEAGEQCDNGAANGPGNCCTATCQLAGASTVCRPSANTCDLAESCTGTSAICPADAREPDGTTCNDSDSCTQTDTCSAGACVG
ncbi:MAG TPA: pre-peptidase C-terminal domain-containing protein, partial [Myxococcaceae bacterium]